MQSSAHAVVKCCGSIAQLLPCVVCWVSMDYTQEWHQLCYATHFPLGTCVQGPPPRTSLKAFLLLCSGHLPLLH